MPPIKIHSDSPINPNAAKPSGASPQTPQDPSQNSRYAPSHTTDDTAQHYPPAQPGAVPGPAPTGAVNQPIPPISQPPPTRTTAPPIQDGPPPPQPGAMPTPPGQTTSSTLPPPPKTGAVAPPPPPSSNPPTTMPPQYAIPPPQSNAAPTHSTMPLTSPTTSTANQPVVLPSYQPPTSTSSPPTAAPPQGSQPSLAHPPGYQQNPYADAMPAEQRMAVEAQEKNDSLLRNLGSSDSPGFRSAAAGGSFTEAGSGAAGGAWDAAKKFMGGVAGKVGEMEEEVWRRVNANSK